MKDRIKKIIESQHMTQQEFAENIKVAPATLSSIFTGRTAPSLKIVEAIKSRFPDISTDWLMFGRGAMTDYKSAEAGLTFGDANPAPVAPDFTVAAENGERQLYSDGKDIADNTIAAMHGEADTDVSSCRQSRNGKTDVNGLYVVKKCDKRERRISEIRIFYDDQTWETFVPKK